MNNRRHSQSVEINALIPTFFEGAHTGNGDQVIQYISVYAACKAGILNFTRTLALDLAEHNIRVNALAPDYTVTPGLRGNIKGPVDGGTWASSIWIRNGDGGWSLTGL